MLYELKCRLPAHGHSSNVLVNSLPDGRVLTGSDDNYMKIWYSDGKRIKKHSIFKGTSALSLCVLPQTDQYPQGLILVGSNDNCIYGFIPDSSGPVLRFVGHSGPVYSLSFGNEYFVSGSSDGTARVWSGDICEEVLHGHFQTVWATAVLQNENLILTGSGDSTIRLWRDGFTERVFAGHEDSVRGLTIVSNTKFLSCSNDKTIRSWLTSGECLEIFRGHTDSVNSLSLLKNGVDFVSCGDDQNIKIWKNGACVQTLVIEAKSLLSVACLKDESLAVGTSEGKMYIFGKVPLYYFEKMSAQERRNSGDPSKLQPPDTTIPMGETMITYGKESAFMYVCRCDYISGLEIKKMPLDFQSIAVTLNIGTSVKEVHNPIPLTSKMKDFMLNVNVKNIFYKLEFNRGENPLTVAEKFVGEHNLQADYVGQIADLIFKAYDPSLMKENKFYPIPQYVRYLSHSFKHLEELRKKFLECCELVPEEKCITELELDELMFLAHCPDKVSAEQLSSLEKICFWNDDLLFPVLNLLRLAVVTKGLWSAEKTTKEFINHLLSIFKSTKVMDNKFLTVTILCNMFGVDGLEGALTSFQDKIFEAVSEGFSCGDENFQKPGSTLFLNFAIASYNGTRLNTDMYCMSVVNILHHVVHADALYNMLLAVGTICCRNSLAVAYFRSIHIKELISKFKGAYDNLEIDKVLSLLIADF